MKWNRVGRGLAAAGVCLCVLLTGACQVHVETAAERQAKATATK